MWVLLSILFAVFAVVLEILKRALQVVSRLNLPAPLFTHKSVVGRRLAGRVGASAPVTRFRGKHSRSHTGGRGTVLEKDSGKYRSITIEPVDCHSYKILQSRVHRFAWFGAGKAESFFFGTNFRLSAHLAIFSIDAWGSKVHLPAPNMYYMYVKRHAVWLLHADLPHRQTLTNLYQEWCCWRKRSWGDVCEMKNLELQFPYTARRANSGTKFPQLSRWGDDWSVNFVTVYDG